MFGFVVVLSVVLVAWILTCGAWQLDEVAAGVAPLDPRTFDAFTVVTAGSGGAYENRARLGPVTALGHGDRVVLVDAGRGCAEALRAARISAAQPDSVFLTNLLPENTVGLDDLLLTGWLLGRSQPLRLVGPAGTRSLAEALVHAHREAIAARGEALGLDPAGARFAVEEVGGGWSEKRDGLEVRAGALPGGPLPALAWRFEADGRSVVVSGTGWAPDALVRFASGSHVLVHEAIFVPDEALARELGMEGDLERLRRESELHTEFAEIGPLAARARVETLVLVRLRPPPVLDLQLTHVVDDAFDGRIVIADDGTELRP
jgi:ribonuclease Z